TGESLYALALAGLTADHPAVRNGLVALLTAQKPFGGWLDLGPYEQFQTPFRETQWSLIALATLYPGPGTKGWDGPLGPQPEALRAIGDRETAAIQPGALFAKGVFVPYLREALESPDDRTRRGATRVFAAHFRDLSQETSLARTLLDRLDDPDPVVQMQAIKG